MIGVFVSLTLWIGVAKEPTLLYADSENSDQPARMRGLIWVFAGRTCLPVHFLQFRLKVRHFLQISDTPEQFVGAKSSAAWNDEQVVVYDCQARLSGYKYVAVLDFDEFLVPLMDRSFERMIVGFITIWLS